MTRAADGADRLQIGMTDFLAIQNDQPVLPRAQNLFLPQEQHLFQLLGIDFREHDGKAALLGTAHAPGVRIQPKLQRPQLTLRKRGGVIGQVFIALGHATEMFKGDNILVIFVSRGLIFWRASLAESNEKDNFSGSFPDFRGSDQHDPSNDEIQPLSCR